MSKFNNRGKSINLSEGVCVRLFEHDCNWAHKGQVLDTTPTSSWVSDFDLVAFPGVSGIKRIDCPTEEPLVVLYDSPGFQGKLNFKLHQFKIE